MIKVVKPTCLCKLCKVLTQKLGDNYYVADGSACIPKWLKSQTLLSVGLYLDNELEFELRLIPDYWHENLLTISTMPIFANDFQTVKYAEWYASRNCLFFSTDNILKYPLYGFPYMLSQAELFGFTLDFFTYYDQNEQQTVKVFVLILMYLSS